jgi:hypothetical protein
MEPLLPVSSDFPNPNRLPVLSVLNIIYNFEFDFVLSVLSSLEFEVEGNETMKET